MGTMPQAQENEDHRYRHLHSTSESVPLRPSLEHAYRSDSESEDDFSDLDAAPVANQRYKNGRKWPWAARFRRILSGERPGQSKERAQRPSPRRKGLRGCCARWKWCLIITGIVLVGLIVVLSGASFWVYKNAPEDGVCFLDALCMTALIMLDSYHLPGIRHLKEAPSRPGKQATTKPKRWLSA